MPDTGWKPPTDFPELRNGGALCIDLETYDPELIKNGPGWARGVGHVLGIAIGTNEWERYYPIAHEIGAEDNCDSDRVIEWLKVMLSNPKQAKLGANIGYDIGWLEELGINVAGKTYDVQYAEALLNEDGDVSLERIAQRTLGEGKQGDVVGDWLRSWSGSTQKDMRKFLYKAPPRLVGPYAEGDVDLPRRVMPYLHADLKAQGLVDLFELECDLIPLLIAMRRKGVSIDIPAAEDAGAQLEAKEIHHRNIAWELAGTEVNFNSANQMAGAFDELHLPYGYTDHPTKPKPKIDKGVLASIDHPFCHAVNEAKRFNKARKVFIESYLLESHVEGKVYCEFKALRGRDGGTRSGRFASANPNLQNIPSRDPFIGPLIRSCFVPDPEHVMWRRYDFSQIEYRHLAHCARGVGSDRLRQQYNDDPKTDYHVWTQTLIKKMTGLDIGRKATKTVNFGLLYGMSEWTLRESLGLTKDQAKDLFAAYHTALPFVGETMDWYKEDAQRTGVTRTILGRTSRFTKWVPQGKDGKKFTPLDYHQALQHYGQYIQRAATHKGLNRRLQGSAADQLKVGMLACWQQGIFDVVGVPRTTVHDELNFSDEGAPESAWDEMKHVMETALPLRVPIIMDAESGPSWGASK